MELTQLLNNLVYVLYQKFLNNLDLLTTALYQVSYTMSLHAFHMIKMHLE